MPARGLGSPALILLLALSACRGAVELGPGVAARIDGRDVAYSRFEAYVESAIGDEASAVDSSVLSALFEQFLEQELLHRLALERRLIAADDSAEQAARRLLEDSPPPPPKESEIAGYYQSRQSEFERGERVLLRQVLIQDRETARSVRDQLVAGVPFENVASRYSEDDSVIFVAERGELARSQLPVAFVEPIFALEEGETSDVLEAEYGFHIFQVVAKRAAGVLPLREVEGTIRRRLERQAADRRLEELVAEARARYNLVVAERNLPFALGRAE